MTPPVYNFQSAPDPIGEQIPYHIICGCQPELTVAWDQWAEATFTCEHGEYTSGSGPLNISQAIDNAIQRMLAHHPPRCQKWYLLRGQVPSGTKTTNEQCARSAGHEGNCRDA